MARKTIGLWSCVAFAVGAMVGAGVFVLSGVAVQDAGPAAILAFVLAGLAVLCSAFSFMAIASLAEQGELGYAPVGRVLGHRFWGFLTSWAFYVSAIIGMAFVLNAFGVYMRDFFVHGSDPLVWALAATAMLAFLNMGKTSAIGRIEGILVVTKVAILVLLIGFGLAHISPRLLRPALPYGVGSVLHTSGLLFISYLGFSVITNIAGDVRDSRRTVPRAILISVLTVLVLYVGVVLALLAFPLHSYNEASVGEVARRLMGPVGGVLIPLAALVSTLSAANSNILGSSEIMVRLAARKDVPTVLGRLRNGHPLASVLLVTAVCAALLMSRRTGLVISLANVAAIAGIGLIDIAAVKLMFAKSGTHRRLPGGPLLPALGLVSCACELFALGAAPVVAGFAIIAVGGTVYLGRKLFHNPQYHRELVAELQTHGGPLIRLLRKLEEH